MLLGSVALSDWSFRYLMPAVPLLAVGGAITLADLCRLRGSGRR